MVKQSHVRALWVLAAAVAVVLSAANLYLGDLNQDEGWYLYAGRMVSHGYLPYRDFAYTQGPVMPFVYAAANPLTERFGVAGGRLFTTILGLIGALAAAGLASRLVVRERRAVTALLTFVLIAVNVYNSYFTTVVKTYSLSALLLVVGFLLLTVVRGRLTGAAAFLSGVAFSLASGVRLSAGIVLPIVFIFLLIERKSRPWAWFWFGGGCAIACGLVFLPLLVMAPEGFLFGLVQYHAGRTAGGFAQAMVYKAGFVSRMVQAYFVAAAIWAAVVLARLFGIGGSGEEGGAATAVPESCVSRPLWIAVLGVTLVHLSAPFPYEDYQVMIFPVFAAAVAAALVRLIRSDTAAAGIMWLIVLLATASAFSSPINQEWFVQGRDRIWWRLKDEPALRKLQRTAAVVRSLAEPGSELLTQDVYLAVESGLRLPRGLELGPFSYYPDWSDARARQCRVMNRAMMETLLRETQAPVAALSGYSLSIRSPAIELLPDGDQEALWRIVRSRYREVRTVPSFGQGFTTLTILVRQAAAAEPGGAAAP